MTGVAMPVEPGRFLFVVPPLVGHVNPAAGVAGILAARGHTVAWAGHGEMIARLAGPGTLVYHCAAPRRSDAEVTRPAELRGPGALKFLWQDFLIPLAEAMLPGVDRAVRDFQPDVMVVDQQAVAGAVVAIRRKIPWATSATTAAELADPLGVMPKVAMWVRELLLDLEHRHGLNTDMDSPRYRRTYGDLRFSPYLVLAYSTAELSGDIEDLLPALRYVGPSIEARAEVPDFPWHRVPQSAPLVLVTMGTANSDAGCEFLTACAAAFADRPRLFGVIADPIGAITDPPKNVLAVPYVPQLELLRRTDAVICHAGQNTVCEALYNAVPLIVAPIRDDQPVIAQQVVDAQAGVRIRFSHAQPHQIATALDEILTEPGYADSASRIAASFRAAGGAPTAADHLEALLAKR